MKKTGEGKRNTTINMQNLGNYFSLYGCHSNNPKNLNNVHKDTKDMVSVIITVGKDISEGYNVFYDGVKTSDLGIKAHILKN